jgi:hypothetical protein
MAALALSDRKRSRKDTDGAKDPPPVGGSPAAGLSLRAYGRRRGTSVEAVRRAIKSHRLVQAVSYDGKGRPFISNPDLADREWSASPETVKAEPSVSQPGEAAVTGSVTGTVTGSEPVTVTPEAPSDDEGKPTAPAATDGLLTVTRSRARKLLGALPERTFARLEAEGVIVPKERGRGGRPSIYDLEVLVPAYVGYLSGQRPLSDREARSRKDLSQAELNELRLARERALLLPRDQVIAEGQAYVKAWTAKIRSLPRRLVQAGAVDREREPIAINLCLELLTEVSNFKTMADLEQVVVDTAPLFAAMEASPSNDGAPADGRMGRCQAPAAGDRAARAAAPVAHDATPYLRGIMDAVHEPGVRKIAVRKAAQVGGSEALHNISGTSSNTTLPDALRASDRRRSPKSGRRNGSPT